GPYPARILHRPSQRSGRGLDRAEGSSPLARYRARRRRCRSRRGSRGTFPGRRRAGSDGDLCAHGCIEGGAMNLAIKDIRFNFMRFALTALGIGFLLLGAIGAIGLYRGIVSDALLVIDRIGADLWVVQGERVGPFSEGSAIPATM